MMITGYRIVSRFVDMMGIYATRYVIQKRKWFSWQDAYPKYFTTHKEASEFLKRNVHCDDSDKRTGDKTESIWVVFGGKISRLWISSFVKPSIGSTDNEKPRATGTVIKQYKWRV